MSVILKLTKRRFYPFQIDGETIHLRAMLTSELDIVQKFRDDDESLGFMIGCCVLSENGTAEFMKTADETPKQFGARILCEVDLPLDTRTELINKIIGLSNGPPSQEKLIKN
jgi:hypothetical protein